MSRDFNETLCRLVGYIDGDMDAPTFIIPVFKDLDTDGILVQVTGTDDSIVSFEKFDSSFKQIVTAESVLKKVGDGTLYGLKPPDAPPIFSDKDRFQATLAKLLDDGLFNDFPAFGLNVAKIINNRSKIGAFKHKLYDEMPVQSGRTRKYFLENNIIREELSALMPDEHRQTVHRMRIDIRDSRIVIKVPETTDEAAREELGRQVTDLYRQFTKSNSVDLSFDDAWKYQEEISKELYAIKSGVFEFDNNIFDVPRHFDFISLRESIVIIPEASKYYYIERRSATQAVYRMISHAVPHRPLSMPTARKIVELDTVSCISAMLFRLWVFGQVRPARHSTSLKLHVCCFKLRREAVNSNVSKLIASYAFARPEYIGDSLLPISFLFFLIRKKILTEDDITYSFEYSRIGIFSPWWLNKDVRLDWIQFAEISNTEELSMLSDRLLPTTLVY